MAQNEYKPVSWNGEAISNTKLNQMCNNTQYIFERMPKIRYATQGLTRDTSLRMIAGKTPHTVAADRNFIYQDVYFGSFFTAGCKPIVTATVEGGGHRNKVVIVGFNGEVDHTGFIAVVSTEATTTLTPAGFIHWTAVGY